MKIKKILVNNIGLKLLALFLAFMTWFYIEGTTKGRSEKIVLRKIFSSTYYISKTLSVKPIFAGEVPKGYKLLSDKVKTVPEFIVVLGPSRILSDKEYIYTEPIDLSEHTKSKIVDVELKSISHAIRFEKAMVQIHLSIEKQ